MKEDRIRQSLEQEEKQLENVYIYTVEQDFREVLKIAFLKDKISKANFEIMIDAFQESLVVLKNNEMHFHNGVEEDLNYRVVKLEEIGNVDYHNQPYFFIVITRDRVKGEKYLYLMFESIETQIKWDRALYCNFVHSKMSKKKEKFFRIDHIEEDKNRKIDLRG